MVPVVSVDPLDLVDPQDWLEPLARLDVRYSSDNFDFWSTNVSV